MDPDVILTFLKSHKDTRFTYCEIMVYLDIHDTFGTITALKELKKKKAVSNVPVLRGNEFREGWSCVV